ncbi:MAG: DUF1156 domain-containing protein [Solirubrobacteraceae bacterium]
MAGRQRLLIEDWLPTAELGIESRREAAPIPGQFPKLKTLHVWWARRPLAASAGAVLGSVMPAWSEELAEAFAAAPELRTAKDYQTWFLRLCGILGDPVAAQLRIAEATEKNIKLGAKAYGYKPAFKNAPSLADMELLHRILVATWGEIPPSSIRRRAAGRYRSRRRATAYLWSRTTSIRSRLQFSGRAWRSPDASVLACSRTWRNGG